MENQKPEPWQTRPEDSNFVPELEYDETGTPKKKPFVQKPYEPLSDYGG